MNIALRHLLAVVALGSAPYTFAQTATQEPPATPPATAAPATDAAAAAPAKPSAWTKHGIDIYLYGDVYGDINFNHPAGGYNQLYNFDVLANQAHLSLAKLSLEKASGIFGFRVDAGVGQTLDIISATDDAPEGFKYLEQFYLEFRPPKSHGLEIDFGKFVTSAGAEVIEAGNNWNYSRSLLFVLAIPYYHFGGRATIPVTKSFTAGVQLVNGWNSVGFNNTLETVGLVGNFTLKKAVWNNTYYTGPQKENGVRAYRQVYDSNVVLTPNSKWTAYINFDWGTDKLPQTSRANWVGVDGAARYQITKRYAAAGRFGWFDDLDGFSTGVAQDIKEITLTGEGRINDYMVARVEWRRDFSNYPYFDRGAGVMVNKNQTTLALGVIAMVGPKK